MYTLKWLNCVPVKQQIDQQKTDRWSDKRSQKLNFFVQVRLDRIEVLRTSSATWLGFKLMTSLSWQYISCHWDACSNHSAINEFTLNEMYRHIILEVWDDFKCTGSQIDILLGTIQLIPLNWQSQHRQYKEMIREKKCIFWCKLLNGALRIQMIYKWQVAQLYVSFHI